MKTLEDPFRGRISYRGKGNLTPEVIRWHGHLRVEATKTTRSKADKKSTGIGWKTWNKVRSWHEKIKLARFPQRIKNDRLSEKLFLWKWVLFTREWKIILISVQCFETQAWPNSDMWLAGIFVKYWIDSRLFWWVLLINRRLLTDDSLTSW